MSEKRSPQDREHRERRLVLGWTLWAIFVSILGGVAGALIVWKLVVDLHIVH